MNEMNNNCQSCNLYGNQNRDCCCHRQEQQHDCSRHEQKHDCGCQDNRHEDKCCCRPHVRNCGCGICDCLRNLFCCGCRK